MKKRVLSILLAMTMVFGMVTTVRAADPAITELTIGGVDALTTSSGTNWEYDGVDTLTLSGDVGTIAATGDLKIRLENDVTITTATYDEPIKVYGSLTIDATGHTLTLDGVAQSRIALCVSRYTIEQTGCLTITGGKVVAYSANTPVEFLGNLTVGNAATLIAYYDGSYNGVAMATYGDIFNNGNIICNAKIRFNNSGKMVTVTNNGNLYYNGNNCANSSNLTVSNNALVVTGVNAYDMATNTVSIRGSNAAIDVQGSASLSCNIIIPEGETAKLSGNSVLTVPSGTTVTNQGAVVITESASISGTIIGNQPELLVYMITFDGNVVAGGWIVPINMPSIQNVRPGNKVIEPEDPIDQMGGRDFVGWYTDPECTMKYDFDTVVTESMTLYAKWGRRIEKTTVTITPEVSTYNGSKQEPAVYVELNGIALTEGTQYTLSWDKNGFVNADTYTVTITGKDNFAGTKTAQFTITPADMDGAVVTLDKDTFVYDGQPHKPTVSVTFNGATLTENVDYEVNYLSSDQIMKWDNGEPVKFFGTGKENSDSINAGQYYAIVRGKGNFAANSRFAYAAYTIKQAKNAWVTEPSISGWTYGEAANAPKAEAKFGAVYVLYDGTANDGTTYDGDTPPTKAGSYVARFFVDEAANYEPIVDGVEFVIAKADQAAPTGLTKTDTTYFGKADGKISGLTSAMEFRKEGDSAYTAGFNGTLEYLAAGTYYVRYQGDANHNPSPDAVVTVNAGRKLQIVVPQNQVGYTVTVNKTEMEYEGSYTLKVEIHEGYTATEDFKIIISNWECGQQAGVEKTYMNAIADQIIEVRGVADITPPAAEIKVKENKWTSFWNNLTFGLFFKETQDVTITTTDKGSGVKSIQYYLFDRELERDEVRSISDWIDYNGTFKINPDNRYVIYAKVTDNAGNVEYINSDGIVLDATAPVLYGIEDGGVYYGDKVFKALDDYLKILKVDGVDVMAELNGDNEYKIIADNAEHTVTAIDKAGNVTEYKITVYKNYTVTYKIDGETVDTQTVGYGKDAVTPTIPAKEGYTQIAPAWDKDGKNITTDTEIHAVYTINKYTVTYKADGEVVETVTVEHGKDATVPAIPEMVGYTQTAPVWDKDGKNITADTEINAVYTINEYTVSFKTDGTEISSATVKHGKDATLPEIPKKDGFVGKWDAEGKNITNDTTISVIYTEIPVVKPNDVKPEDKTNLEDAKAKFEEMLKDGGYAEDAKKNIQDTIDNIDDALEVIGNVEAVEERIDKLPDTIKKDDEAAIKAADDAYNALSDYEKALVDEAAKKALTDAKAALAELNKPADTDSPQTGDNSNMFLWIALLFISGGAVIILTVVDRKRRIAKR